MSRSTVARRSAALLCLPLGWLASRFAPGIRILMYHRVNEAPEYDQLNVSPERFDAQMAHLRRHCEVLSLAAAVTRLRHASPPVQPGRPSVVVTFDDGYRDNLVHALPILRKHDVPATIFITTDFTEQRLHHPRYGASPGRLHLDWDEVRHLAVQPGITIGSHTISHPYLSRVEFSAAEREIRASRSQIEARLGRMVDSFCYPSGDVTEREVQLVRAAGYAAAVTVAPGINRATTPLFELKRTEMTDRDDGHDLALKLLGAYDPLHAALHLRRRRQFANAARSHALERANHTLTS